MSTVHTLTQAAKEEFLDRNKNLLALTKNGANDVFRRLSAALALDTEAQADVMLFVDVVDQKGYAGQVAREDFKNAMYAAIAKAFIKIQHNHVVEFVSEVTGEALSELEAIEVVAGQREAPAPVAPLPPPKSAQEQLEDQVREDWHRLETSKMRKKMNDPAYKAVVDKLMADGSLESQITTLTDHGAEFRR